MAQSAKSAKAAAAAKAPEAAPTPAPAPAAEAAPAAPAAQPAPAATPVPEAAPEVAKLSVENPYGLEAMWRTGDMVSKGTLVLLVLMSIGSWYIGVLKVIEQAKVFRHADEARKKFWQGKSVVEGAQALHVDSAFRFIADAGADARQHHEGTMVEHIALNDWVALSLQRSVDTVSNRLQGGLAFLATVGSTAPFVGLFGTVWGIYHALTAIGIAGQASIDKVAGPVGEALIMTALGLAVAVPAVLGYNWLVRRNKVAMDRVRYFSGELHKVLLASNAAGARQA
ncbi:MAG: MotA/TolQ/ExbB proton channel family protein [Burkholderiaceae bacterium]|nr:MotA/TolQ/ExbB proton channel family protein [Burkholderiaceae bacterium]